MILTPQQAAAVTAVPGLEQLADAAVVRAAAPAWQSVARVVARALIDPALDGTSVPDSYLAQRLQHLVSTGRLEGRPFGANVFEAEVRSRA